MKTSEISKGGLEIVNSVFSGVLKSESKEDWKKAIEYADKKMKTLELTVRGSEMFFWRNAKYRLLSKFGKKFVGKSQTTTA